MDGLREDGFYGAPDLLIEVLSSKPALDPVVKLQKYARAGVPHYWLVDPNRRTLTAYRLEAGRYRIAAEPTGEAQWEPELFPGLIMELAELWS